MEDFYSLDKMEQVKALAEPLRVRVLELLCQKPMTAKQIALALGEKPTKLYHHVEALERVGLIRLTETRPVRGTTEKYYEAIARRFAIDRNLLKMMPEAAGEVAELFTGALEETIHEIRESASLGLINPEDGNNLALLSRSHVRLTKAQLAELLKKMQDWIEECGAANDRKGTLSYAMTLAFYPVKEPAKTKSSAPKKTKAEPAKKPAK